MLFDSPIVPAVAADLQDLAALLTGAGLPARELDTGLARLLVARDGARLIGCVGFERYGGAALLRSLAVDPEHRARGLGRRLVERVLEEAARTSARELVLLTQGAAEFFERFGFAACARDEVDPALADSWEFRHHACDDAQVMHRALGA